MTTTRLLLPATGGINALALNYALQLAAERQATLVPLALIKTRPGRAVRLGRIEQAEDFLQLARCKAERQGVPVELARVYTSDPARSIEAIAGELACEAVVLFLHPAEEVLLAPDEIGLLMDHAACDAHLVLLPGRGRRSHLRHFLALKASAVEQSSAMPAVLLDSLLQHRAPELHRLAPENNGD